MSCKSFSSTEIIPVRFVLTDLLNVIIAHTYIAYKLVRLQLALDP